MAAPALAATYTTVDLTGIDGTSWSNINDQPVRIDFGAGLGTGTITLTSFNGGGATPVPTDEFSQFNYTADLGNGNSLVSTTSGTGYTLIETPQFSPDIGLSGFDLTFTLDSGEFQAGSLFLAGSLGLRGVLTPQSFFSPGDEFAAPLSVSLPGQGVAPLVQGADGLYVSSGPYRSETRAFALADDTNSFSVRLLSEPTWSKSRGAISFSFASVSAVPEPATWAMMIVGFGLSGAAIRGRRGAGLRTAQSLSAT